MDPPPPPLHLVVLLAGVGDGGGGSELTHESQKFDFGFKIPICKKIDYCNIPWYNQIISSNLTSLQV